MSRSRIRVATGIDGESQTRHARQTRDAAHTKGKRKQDRSKEQEEDEIVRNRSPESQNPQKKSVLTGWCLNRTTPRRPENTEKTPAHVGREDRASKEERRRMRCARRGLRSIVKEGW